jgi:3-hydroxybutyrate dehydrogenase
VQAGGRQALDVLDARFGHFVQSLIVIPTFYWPFRLKFYLTPPQFQISFEDIMQGITLQGKTALVTGSTSGIGLGIARKFAAQGANIVFNGFGDLKEIEALQADVKEEFKVQTAYHNADMSKPAEIEAMMHFAAERFGGVDVLVNNAGIQYVANIEDFPVEKWDAIIAINLSSTFHTTRLALPSMKAKNWGRIINIASVHGLVGSAQKSAYVAAKHGIVGFTKVTALETAHTGITCNAICPGWVLTPLVQKQVDARSAEQGISNEAAKKSLLSEKQPSGEFVTPEQLGELAVFLSSDAASQVRGVAWNMDGGWVAQ